MMRHKNVPLVHGSPTNLVSDFYYFIRSERRIKLFFHPSDIIKSEQAMFKSTASSLAIHNEIRFGAGLNYDYAETSPPLM